MEHTPIPWFVNGPSNIYAKTIPTERRANGELIPPLDKCVAQAVLGWGISEDEREANAAYIVRACNHHEELAGALKELLSAYRVKRPQIFGTDEIEEHVRAILEKIEKEG